MQKLETDPTNNQLSITINDLIDLMAFILPTINSDFGKVDPAQIQVNGLYIYRRDGLLAYADGTNWNPNSEGKGFYRYDTGTSGWVKVG